MIKQNIVFIENKAGSLQKVTGLLKEAGIDIYGFACFDAPEFALFRMVTDKADEAEKILTENGYMNRVTEVIAVDIKDEVGGLNAVLEVLGNCNVNLDYIYTSYHRGNSLPIMILQTDDVFVTENVLTNNGRRRTDLADKPYFSRAVCRDRNYFCFGISVGDGTDTACYQLEILSDVILTFPETGTRCFYRAQTGSCFWCDG